MWVVRFGPKGRTPNLVMRRRTLFECVRSMSYVMGKHRAGAHSRDRYFVTDRCPMVVKRVLSSGAKIPLWNHEVLAYLLSDPPLDGVR